MRQTRVCEHDGRAVEREATRVRWPPRARRHGSLAKSGWQRTLKSSSLQPRTASPYQLNEEFSNCHHFSFDPLTSENSAVDL